MMQPMFTAYLTAWLSLTLAAFVLASSDPLVRSELRPYLRFLAMPWKLAVFAPAGLFVTFAGQFAFDDTWDRVTGGGMSLLTYLTAPWAVGTVYRVAAANRPLKHAFVAAIACLFSASWFYDGWLLYRDGQYTEMWLPNLLLSPFLYVAGGLLWNLEADDAGKPVFGFTRSAWPEPPTVPQSKPSLVFAAIPPIILAAGILLLSVTWRLPG